MPGLRRDLRPPDLSLASIILFEYDSFHPFVTRSGLSFLPAACVSPDMPISENIAKLRDLLPRTMLRDRAVLSRRLERLLTARKGRTPGKKDFEAQLEAMEKRAEASALEMEKRAENIPRIEYPEELPITSMRDDIIRAVREHQVVVVSGDTGSGKSTQLPKMCLEAGRGIAGKIGCTQPRRIAAATISRRIAEELGEKLGKSVGYKIRFRDRTPRSAYIKVMTDGILLAETRGDPGLHEYDTLIVDEAHERSLNIDFILGILRTLIPRRPELRVIITSATLDTRKFSEAFGNAPVIEIKGRLYPVETVYRPQESVPGGESEVTWVDTAVEAVEEIYRKKRPGDILVFMPTERDVLETCERLSGRNFPGTSVLPLYARLPASQQGRVYSVKGRKIVVATNVAETSLTIPGITYVIDTGLARIARYLPRTRTNSLPVSPISRSSADQRKGRCGRVRDGICIRLYSEEDYESRPEFTPPEILRSNLAEVLLRMVDLKLGDPHTFPFIDPPNPRSIKDGFDILEELGAVERRGGRVLLTERGRVMARMPLDPRISRMMLEAAREGCVKEVAVIAAALSIQDPRERPADKTFQADQIHGTFRDPESDFLTLLNIWDRFHKEWKALKTQNRIRKFCKAHFLSFSRMREWIDTHDQIMDIFREHAVMKNSPPPPADPASRYAGIHRSVLAGFLSNIALLKDKNIYRAARGREVMVFPGSTLFNKKAPWIVAAEMVKTSRLFARTAAKIDPGWLESLGEGLCRSSYSEPHWEKNRGEVRAYEQVTLYGLPIVSRRPVSYGPIDPEESHRIFVRHALVEGDLKPPLPPFLRHNRNLIRSLETMEDKLRRRDILIGEEALADFYSRRLAGVYDVRTLRRRIRERGGDGFLRMKKDDLLRYLPEESELALFPDEVKVGETRLKTSYKFAPGREEDGLTVQVPSSIASRISSAPLDWGVPGLLREKITAFIKGLPKRYRKQLVPVSGTVETVMKEMERTDEPLLTALARFVYRRFGVDIPASVWTSVEIPMHLQTRVSITDSEGKEIESGRDIHKLMRGPKGAPLASDDSTLKRVRDQWERENLKDWDFDFLPARVPLPPRGEAYPALESTAEGVNIKIFRDPDEALASHMEGVSRLLELRLAKDLKFLKRNWTLPGEAARAAAYFGGGKEIEKSLYRSLLGRFFRKDIRTRGEFESYARHLEQTMFEEARQLRNRVIEVLLAYQETRSILHTLEGAAPSNRAVQELCGRVRRELDALVPRDFIECYPPERLAHLPRYLKALEIRAERGANHPEKDRTKEARVAGFVKAMESMVAELPPHASREKREGVEAFRWMIEEYKVSVFAQELKTPYPVSEKRLEMKRKELERML